MPDQKNDTFSKAAKSLTEIVSARIDDVLDYLAGPEGRPLPPADRLPYIIDKLNGPAGRADLSFN